ncbi:MAG: type I glyceraldehyde-3-phosphate dehydrogenase [Bacteroidota bacterium]
MTKIKVAINGFGRIGRMFLRAALLDKNMEVVAINDISDTHTLAYLFKYDSVHGRFVGTVSSTPHSLIIDGVEIKVCSEKAPEQLPWNELGIGVVIESTGRFTSAEDAEKHILAGAKKIIISAPGKGNLKTIVLGVNEASLDGTETVISNASCTTNNAAPMLKVLDDLWGVKSAFITTIHSYTGDQNLHDAPHKDLRRARAAAVSIIPTTTGAAKAITDIFPNLKGKIGGAGIRVPVPDGSLTDITCTLNKTPSVDEINAAFKLASETNLKQYLEYSTDPIVSIDIVNNPHSCIFDSLLTTVVGDMVKIVGWYDNEIGYSNRLVDLINLISKK